MVMKAAELIALRNEFYARSFDQIKKVVTMLIVICSMLIGFSIYQTAAVKLFPKYIPTTPDGRLIISPSMSENHLLLSKQTISPTTGIIEGMPPPVVPYADLQADGENALILYWAKLAVEDMFDYDYIHYRSVIERARKYFTAPGHEKFIQALIDSKNLETVKVRSAIVIPEVLGKVKLVNTELYYNHFSWDIEVNLRLTYQSAADPKPIVQNLLAKLSIARISTLVSPFYGLAIYQLNFEQVFDQESN